jgi:hypothetical protein
MKLERRMATSWETVGQEYMIGAALRATFDREVFFLTDRKILLAKSSLSLL